MKKQFVTSKNIKVFIAIVLILLAALCISFIAFFLLPNVASTVSKTNKNSQDRRFHVLVLGRSENETFLQQVYAGAKKSSQSYNAVVELYVPGSLAEDVSLQSLFDYAALVNADGIIAYIDSADDKLSIPTRIDGEKIPLITLGHYSPDLQQVSFIGTNYSELGRKIAEETNLYLHGKGSAFIINSSSQNNPNYSTLMNSLISTLNMSSGISYNVVDHTPEEKNLISENPLRICLTAGDTIRAVQTVTELNKIKQIGIIGFGDNNTIELYFEKGIISELISVDPERIGETAISELFEYRNNGYANSYITANVQIRKPAK